MLLLRVWHDPSNHLAITCCWPDMTDTAAGQMTNVVCANIGCIPSIPPFPSSTICGKSADYYMSALVAATSTTTVCASPPCTSAIVNNTGPPATSVSAPGSGRLSRRGCLQQLEPPPDKTSSLDRHHHHRSDSCGPHHSHRDTATSSSSADLVHAAANGANQDMTNIDETNLGGSQGMVCFPGLAHSGTEAREGQVPQPLLARVDYHRNGLTPSPRHPLPQSPLFTLQQRPSSLVPSREIVTSHELRAHSEVPCQLPSSLPHENQVIQHPEHLSLPPSYFQDVSVPPPVPPPPCDIQQSFSVAALSPIRGAPPPYHGIHTVIPNNQHATGMQSPTSYGSPDPGSSPYSSERSLSPCSTLSPASPVQPSPPEIQVQRQCFYPHPPTVACRKCNSVRLSNRHNAAVLVRRANSNAEAKRKSAQMVCGSSGGDSSEDERGPSILERLRREWQATVGNTKIQFEITHSPPQSPPPPPIHTPSSNQSFVPTQNPVVQQQSSPPQPPVRQQQVLKQSSPLPLQTISSHSIQSLQQSLPPSQSPCTDIQTSVSPPPPPQSPPLHRPPQSPKRSPQPPGRTALQIKKTNNSISVSDTNSNNLQVPNNKNTQDQLNKNNLNVQNEKMDSKIELVILEDTDELKSSCTKAETLQIPFHEII